MADVIEIYKSYQYDGTNGSALAAMVNGGFVYSDTGTHVVIDDGASQHELGVGDWLLLRCLSDSGTFDRVYCHLTNTQYQARFRPAS